MGRHYAKPEVKKSFRMTLCLTEEQGKLLQDVKTATNFNTISDLMFYCVKASILSDDSRNHVLVDYYDTLMKWLKTNEEEIAKLQEINGALRKAIKDLGDAHYTKNEDTAKQTTLDAADVSVAELDEDDDEGYCDQEDDDDE